MASSGQNENIISAFTVALARMNRVTDYLRENGEFEAANQIAKNVNEMVSHFTTAAINLGKADENSKEDFDETDPFTHEGASVSFDGSTNKFQGLREAKTNKGNERSADGHSKTSSKGKEKDTSNEWTAGSLVNAQVSKGKQKEQVKECESSPAPTGPMTRNNHVSRLTSWARIAASPPVHDNVVVKPKPVVLKMHARQPSQKPVTYAAETLSEQLRVIWVVGCTKETSLTFITDQIHEGPLLSVAFSIENAAMCIVFQYGSSAASFLETNGIMMTTRGVCCYGPGYELMVGSAFSMTADLKAMEPPLRERRRLTFVKAGLFQEVAPAQFEKDLLELVGPDNIERVHIFNTGNGSVVFSSTSVARMVRENFNYRASLGGPYQGVTITYSSDPCEKPVNWTSQHQYGTGTPNRRSPRHSPKNRSGNAGDDTPSGSGWERVKHRRR